MPVNNCVVRNESCDLVSLTDDEQKYGTEGQIKDMSNCQRVSCCQQMHERLDVANLLSDTSEVIFGPILGEL